MSALIPLVLAIVLYVLGLWGRINAGDLPPLALPEEEREHRSRVLRRGAVTCQFVAVLLAVIAAIELIAILAE